MIGEERCHGVYEMGGHLIVPVPSTINEHSAMLLSGVVVKEIEARFTKKVILDLSEVEVVNTRIFRLLTESVKMAGLMGAESVIVGIQPGVALALVNLDTNLEGVRTALNVESGMALLNNPLEGTIGG